MKGYSKQDETCSYHQIDYVLQITQVNCQLRFIFKTTDLSLNTPI